MTTSILPFGLSSSDGQWADEPTNTFSFEYAKKLALHLQSTCTDGWEYHLVQSHTQKYCIYITDPNDDDFVVGWL